MHELILANTHNLERQAKMMLLEGAGGTWDFKFAVGSVFQEQPHLQMKRVFCINLLLAPQSCTSITEIVMNAHETLSERSPQGEIGLLPLASRSSVS